MDIVVFLLYTHTLTLNPMLDKQKWQELLKRAKSGDSTAQVEVGLIYSEGYMHPSQGLIVKQNSKLAYKWYEKASEQDDIDGVCYLAYHLDCGIGRV